MEDRDVPAHSNKPWSRDTPNVMSVGTGGMPISLRKAMKFAGTVSPIAHHEQANGLTIGGAVHDNEASINVGIPISMLERNCVGVTAKSVFRFVKMNFMVGTFKSP